jgi:heme/copper-type cytochrome/quinol oxidase subunit 2
MCKNAVGSDRNHLPEAINASVLFMIGMIFVILAGFLAVVWWSYRNERRRARTGVVFAPEGKLRWTAADDPAPDRGRS